MTLVHAFSLVVKKPNSRAHPLQTKTYAAGTHPVVFAAAFLFSLLSSASAFSLVSPAWSARLRKDLQSISDCVKYNYHRGFYL